VTRCLLSGVFRPSQGCICRHAGKPRECGDGASRRGVQRWCCSQTGLGHLQEIRSRAVVSWRRVRGWLIACGTNHRRWTDGWDISERKRSADLVAEKITEVVIPNLPAERARIEGGREIQKYLFPERGISSERSGASGAKISRLDAKWPSVMEPAAGSGIGQAIALRFRGEWGRVRTQISMPNRAEASAKQTRCGRAGNRARVRRSDQRTPGSIQGAFCEEVSNSVTSRGFRM